MEICSDDHSTGKPPLAEALNGNIDAQFELALSLETEQKDLELALCWYKKAAMQGHVEAAYRAGVLCMRSKKQLYEEAAYWLHKAAGGGHSMAQHDLGDMYEKGKGVKLDPEASVYWHREAAKRGNADSQAKIQTLNSWFDL
jgi:uncharacterized protein